MLDLRAAPAAPNFLIERLAMVPGVRPLWRRLLAWHFRLFQRHRYRRLILEAVGDAPILVLPDVFNPKLFRTGEFLAGCLAAAPAGPDAMVLDLGTGSGVGAIFAARSARRVIAVDLNPEAVRCAQINVLLNRVEERVEIRHGDLFAPVQGEFFDLVLFNPPYYAGTPSDALDLAWRSEDIRLRFAAGLPEVLAPGGRAMIVLSSDAGVPQWETALQAHGMRASTFAQRDLINETLTVFDVRRANDHPL